MEPSQDPWALDPCFDNEEEMSKYLRDIGQINVVIRDNVEVEIEHRSEFSDLNCSCGCCERIEVSPSVLHAEISCMED